MTVSIQPITGSDAKPLDITEVTRQKSYDDTMESIATLPKNTPTFLLMTHS